MARSTGRAAGAQRTKRIHAGRVAEVPPYDGKLALGVWHYTAKYAEFDLNNLGDPKESRGNNGVYAFAEHVLYQQAGSDAGLRGFLRVGAADPRFNRVAYYVGSGVVYRGPIKGRESDEIGLAVAAARNGSDFRDAQERTGAGVDDWEVAIELTYRTQLLPWLALQPDIQYIINPGTDPSVDNALVLATRFQISF